VDDTAPVRNALVTLFDTNGYHARGAKNGGDALRVLRDGFPASLVVLDMVMPEMDGWEFRRAQRADPALAAIPLVVLTAVVNPALEAEKLGAVAGFRKPLDVYALLDVVREVCPLPRVARKNNR
jgi:CheY-like chemotaxis protein